MDPQIYKDIELSRLTERVQEYKERGWRFTNLCGSTVQGEVELLYSFSAGRELENLVLMVSKDDVVPSISGIIPNSFVFENETHDLYGVAFKDMSLDYGGVFYPTSVPTPMNPASRAAQSYLEDLGDEGEGANHG